MELYDYFLVFKKKLWIIVLAILISTFLAGIANQRFLQSRYQASTILIIQKNIYTERMSDYRFIYTNDQAMVDYTALVKNKSVADKIIKELELKNISDTQILRMIGIHLKQNGSLIEIYAQHSDREFAQAVANKAADIFALEVGERIYYIKGAYVLSKAELPVSPIKPDSTLNIITGAFLGLLLGLCIVLIREYQYRNRAVSKEV